MFTFCSKRAPLVQQQNKNEDIVDILKEKEDAKTNKETFFDKIITNPYLKYDILTTIRGIKPQYLVKFLQEDNFLFRDVGYMYMRDVYFSSNNTDLLYNLLDRILHFEFMEEYAPEDQKPNTTDLLIYLVNLKEIFIDETGFGIKPDGSWHKNLRRVVNVQKHYFGSFLDKNFTKFAAIEFEIDLIHSQNKTLNPLLLHTLKNLFCLVYFYDDTMKSLSNRAITYLRIQIAKNNLKLADLDTEYYNTLSTDQKNRLRQNIEYVLTHPHHSRNKMIALPAIEKNLLNSSFKRFDQISEQIIAEIE